MGSSNYSLAIRPDTGYIRKIIESSLLADWAIRIEHLSDGSDQSHWQLWDKTFFAIRESKHVIEALLDCYTKNPKSIIRISAEKFRPQTRMQYTVYDPSYLPAETESQPQASPGQPTWKQNRPSTQIGITT